MAKLEVRVAPPVSTDHGTVRLSARLRSPARHDEALWYEVAGLDESAVVDRADPFLVACVALAMREPADVRIVGAPVSPSLLRNLEEFETIWHAWFDLPVVDLDAESTRADPQPASTITAFSGGVDSAFTVWRALHDPPRHGRRLDAALMIHGMDIPVTRVDAFQRASARVRRMLDGTGLPLVTVATNAWALLPEGRTHFPGVGVAAALHTVGGRFGAGLVPSTASYREALKLDSTPTSDWLLGSDAFAVVHDGAGFERLAKVRELAKWDAALDDLRVCLEDPRGDRNCGRCRKCILTHLEFRVAGVELRCFEDPPTEAVVTSWARRFSSAPYYVGGMGEVLREAAVQGIDEPWVRVARRRHRMLVARDVFAQLSPDTAARVDGAYRRLAGLVSRR